MKKNRLYLVSFLTVLLFFVSIISAYAKEREVIVVGDDLDYPPYAFINEEGDPDGFSIELIKAIGNVMELDVEVKLGTWSEVRSQLESGKIDAIAGMFYSKERLDAYDFTTKHTVSVGDIFGRTGKQISNIKDLNGKTIVVQEGDIVEEYLKGLDIDAKFVEVPTISEALRLVSVGKYDYAGVLKILGYYKIDKLKLKNLESKGIELNSNDYCIAVKKGNEELRVKLDTGLRILKSTGEYQRIYDKWLGVYEKRDTLRELKKYSWIVALIIALLVLKLIEKNIKLRRSEARNRAIVNAMPDLIFLIDDKGYFVDCWARYQEALLLPKSDIIGKNIEDIMPQDISIQSIEKIKSAIENNTLESFEYQLIIDGTTRFFELRMVKSTEKEVVAIARDMTEEKIVKKALKEETELLKITLLSIGDGVIVTDKYGKIEMMNHTAEDLTGWTEREAKQKNFEDVFNIISDYSRKKMRNPVSTVLEKLETVELEEGTVLISKNKKERWISDSVSPIMDSSGNLQGAILVFRDVTSEIRNQRRIEYLSYHDQLTGLYNRRFFEEEMKRLDVTRNLPITVAMADVNGLKLINDSFGHSVGDELLLKVSNVLKKGCRSDDIIARIGGDEFVILLVKTDYEETEKVIRRIKNLASKEQVGSLEVSVSFGWESKYKEDDKIEEILRRAEDMMYKNKLFEGPNMRNKAVEAIIRTVNERNQTEEKHSIEVSRYAAQLGSLYGFSEKEIQELKIIGLFHDIGKIAIDEEILIKKESLTLEEMDEIKKHPEIGYRILNTISHMNKISEYVLLHHERWDGKGYPKGIKGKDIPVQSRIIAIVDAYDAMNSERPYRRALSKEEIIEEFEKNMGSQFDPELARIFVDKILKNL